ncbi:hypothetical protein [Corallincola spongiicola]|uniref:Glycosyltransferase GT-D fold domain-containing protein n=1 Tax=Corallincola spongiicola TaxID=2520508 RepID=A0ABY1WKA3_9GAMM|nr:hypothetical protein [Corallincola spongiicola]TAA39590.1 hypothetical protein EXY25_18600 [Corallincola spongiicola]
MIGSSNIPDATEHLHSIIKMLSIKKPFTFVRFSDGEIEILRNRFLEISGGVTHFRGRVFRNNYPKYDAKMFDPSLHGNIRRDLLESAMFRGANFYKGIPSSHNNALIDREFMLRLNGGFDSCITFSDLLLNSNYALYRTKLVPVLKEFKDLYLVANYRANPIETIEHAKHINVPDNFFGTYNNTIDSIYNELLEAEKGALVLSSASSLSKILGYKLYRERSDITFLDIGTSINDLLSLDNNVREYHKSSNSKFSSYFLRRKRGYKIKW